MNTRNTFLIAGSVHRVLCDTFQLLRFQHLVPNVEIIEIGYLHCVPDVEIIEEEYQHCVPNVKEMHAKLAKMKLTVLILIKK